MLAIRRDDLTGRRLQRPGDPVVWLVIDGERRRIPDQEVYDRLFSSDVDGVLPFEQIDDIRMGPDLIAGTCLAQDESDSRIYLVTGPTAALVRKHHVESFDTFVAFGFAMSRVVRTPKLLIDKLEVGGVLRSASGHGAVSSEQRWSSPEPTSDEAPQVHERPTHLRISVGVVISTSAIDAVAACQRVSASVQDAIERSRSDGIEVAATLTALVEPSAPPPPSELDHWQWIWHPRASAGFAAGQNELMSRAFTQVSEPADWHLLVDKDALPDESCIYEMLRLALSRPAGLVEATLFPREPAKPFDLYSFETPWCTMVCTLISAHTYAAIGGFDESLPDRLHDVDLSWRARRAGHVTRTAPAARCAFDYVEFQDDEDRRRTFVAARRLGLKWNATDFAAWAEHELVARGYAPDPWPGISASTQCELDRTHDDRFLHGFDFAPPRWKLPGASSLRHQRQSRSTTPVISVVVRTHQYGRLPLLRRALLSLALQQGVRVEAIVMTQGFSEEALLDVRSTAAAMCEAYPTLEQISVRNVQSDGEDLRARLLNDGIGMASSRHIAFLDDDDVVYRSAYRTLIGQLDKADAAVAVGRCVRVEGEYRNGAFLAFSKSRPFIGNSLIDLIADNFCPIHSYVIDRDTISSDVLQFDLDAPYLEDYRFLLRLAERADFSFLMNEDVGEYWFYYDGSNTTSRSSNSFSSVAEGYRKSYRITEAMKAKLQLTLSFIDIELWAKTNLNGISRATGLSSLFADPTEVAVDAGRGARDSLRLCRDLLS